MVQKVHAYHAAALASDSLSLSLSLSHTHTNIYCGLRPGTYHDTWHLEGDSRAEIL